MQTSDSNSKIQYKPQDNQTLLFNEQPFTFQLQHDCKFHLILLFYDDMFC